ncbi:50S ribosomal protein L14e [Candidatus Woesearchaeota archaeon]|nr:50S ribosomal protein L14e [Candidatus Woesearchaeota archaeon]
MSIFTVGRLCLKLAGRDAGRKCIVVEELDSNYVLIDGNVRRRKTNVNHLEPLAEVLDIKKNLSHEAVKELFQSHNWPVWDHNSKQPAEKPKKHKKVKGQSGKSGKKDQSAKKEKSAAPKAKKEKSKKAEDSEETA